jgi:DNA (cytosine-5)-methyltransferase 1
VDLERPGRRTIPTVSRQSQGAAPRCEPRGARRSHEALRSIGGPSNVEEAKAAEWRRWTGGQRSRGGERELIKCFDFFCGAGGLTRGLLDAEIDVLCGIDIDERLQDTYEKNNEPSRFEQADIGEIDIASLRKKYGVRKKDVTLYAACTPCQPFSTLNQRRGVDERKQLLLQFAELVRFSPPDFVLVENVPGLGNAYGRDIYNKFLTALDDAGLVHRDARKLDAQDYGVPQIRKRFLLIASKHGPISLPEPETGEAKTVREALAGLPEPGSKAAPPNHEARVLKDHHKKIVREIPVDGGSRSEVEDTSVLLECHRRNPNVHKDVFGRMWWDKPSPTLTCRCTDVYCGRFVHPEEDRGLTLREAAALQSFGHDYEFHADSLFFAARQVGNAVPVALARRLGETVGVAASAI